MAFVGELFEFQQEAMDFMLERRKVLVAYEMGLGKTVITIATLEELFEREEIECGLIVVLSSLKYQWAQQIEHFTGGEASPIVIDGTPKQREQQYAAVMRGDHDYVILNYEQVVNDWDKVSKLPRDFVVCDEVTAIKSFKAKRSKKVKRLQADYLYGLSGQPIENLPEEAFSIMQWIDKTVLGSFETFDRAFIVRNAYGGVKFYRNLKTFHQRMQSAMVRKSRHDPDVRDQMPSVTEQSRFIDFDPAGRKLYRHITQDLVTDLAEVMSAFGTFDLWSHYRGDSNPAQDAARGAVMSKLTCLRMLCDHPELLKYSASLYREGAIDGSAAGSAYANDLYDDGMLNAKFKAPKMDAAMELMTEILEADPRNKIVLFSFFKPTLSYLRAALKKNGVGAVKFTGGMSAKSRDIAKRKFQIDPDVRVFLSSDAGGYGVDLPQANYLINYDLPWSSGKLEQRNARIIRLSTEWDTVTLINLLMRGSIEERQYQMLQQKKAIASAVIDGKGIDRQGRLTLSLTSLTNFLTESEV